MALGWPVSENGPMPGLPMRPDGQVAVDDGVDLVGALGGLIDALRIERHRFLRRREPGEECLACARRATWHCAATAAAVRRNVTRAGERLEKPSV